MNMWEWLIFILPVLVFYALAMWLSLGSIPHSLLQKRLVAPIIFVLVLLSGVIFFAGVFGVLILYGVWLGMALGLVRASLFANASRRIVILGTSAAIIVLISGSLWFWGYYSYDGPIRSSFGGDFEEFMWQAATAGRMIYLLPAATGTLTAVIAALFSRAPRTQSLALTVTAILALFASPLLVWFDFLTSCMVGQAVFITWSTLC